MASRKILNISMPDELYEEIALLAKKEKKTKAELAREILRKQVLRDKQWNRIRNQGEETARKIGLKDERDVEEFIHQYREESF